MTSNNQFIRLAHVEDGFSVKAKLPETPFYPEVRFEFRPMVGRQQYETEVAYSYAIRNGDGNKAASLMVGAVAKHLTAWSLTPTISVESVSRLEPNLLGALYQTVTRQVPAIPQDHDPATKARDYADELLGSAMGKDTVGRDLGN